MRPEPITPVSAAVRTRKSGVVVPHKPAWHQRLVAGLIFLVERLMSSTWRLKWDDRAGMAAGTLPGPVIYCLWHNRLALSMCVWRNYVRRHLPNSGLAALISASKDGALLACTLERFGVQPVRGSSSRRGPQALLELTSWLERGHNLAITPDGPRGPAERVKPGLLYLASRTGFPIVPVASFVDFDEGMELVNGHGYGLSASIYTTNPRNVFAFRERCSAGMLSINNSTSGAEAHLPFGGNGKSGNGARQSGVWMLDQVTRWQSMNWDYSGRLQKAQMDVADIEADVSFRLED